METEEEEHYFPLSRLHVFPMQDAQHGGDV